jgi:hypothetical protein
MGQLQQRCELWVASIIAKNMSSKEAFRLGKCCISLLAQFSLLSILAVLRTLRLGHVKVKKVSYER